MKFFWGVVETNVIVTCSCMVTLEHCCRDIEIGMLENRLKISGDKTEVWFYGPSSLQKMAQIEHGHVGESQINLSASVRDLGLLMQILI